MARIDLAHPGSVEGPWFVDTRCIRCDAARHWAPGLIEMDDQGLSFVARQPEGAEETAALWRAAVACPTQSIGTSEARRPPSPVFPFELTPGVYALGRNTRESFGAHSYLVPRRDGNLMTDSPRFTRGLAERIDDIGGVRHVLLSHRDDVADADRWAERYGADVSAGGVAGGMGVPRPRQLAQRWSGAIHGADAPARAGHARDGPCRMVRPPVVCLRLVLGHSSRTMWQFIGYTVYNEPDESISI